jgi:GTP-binding protein YchF
MRLGIVGLPVSGKTTVYNALTASDLPTGNLAGGGRLDVHTAAVDVPDERLIALRDLYHPKKTTFAKVEIADFGGLRLAAGHDGVPGPVLNELGPMDGFLHVVRAFEDPSAPHPDGGIDPSRDLQRMESEFLLNDMVVVDHRLGRLREERQKGGRDRGLVDRDIALFLRLEQALGEERPLRSLLFTEEEARSLTGFALLSRKPMLAVINLAEGDEFPPIETAPHGVRLLGLQAKLESELAQLTSEEAAAYAAEYGIDEPGRVRVLRSAYDLLGVQTFFTVSEEEVRAWRLPRGGTALEAAGTVHSDLARGFIRAEVIAWEELVELGGLSQARARGRLRLEGKDYPVDEGEVVQIRFNV